LLSARFVYLAFFIVTNNSFNYYTKYFSIANLLH